VRRVSFVQKSDPLGYYAALNISPGASREEVRLAYRFLKKSYFETRSRKIKISKAQAAYEMLNDPKRKSAYDRGDVSAARAGGAVPAEPGTDWKERLRKYGAVTAVVLVVVLVGLVYTFYGSAIRGAFNHFEQGDTLYRPGGTMPLGTVELYESDHVFPNGRTGNAYRIRPAAGGDPLWYPARDLDRYFEKR
jgi:hypothetical protein